jgi:hypothetical protein
MVPLCGESSTSGVLPACWLTMAGAAVVGVDPDAPGWACWKRWLMSFSAACMGEIRESAPG